NRSTTFEYWRIAVSNAPAVSARWPLSKAMLAASAVGKRRIATASGRTSTIAETVSQRGNGRAARVDRQLAHNGVERPTSASLPHDAQEVASSAVCAWPDATGSMNSPDRMDYSRLDREGYRIVRLQP